jgi:hypothetical protein
MTNNDNGQAKTMVVEGQQQRHHQQQATINVCAAHAAAE